MPKIVREDIDNLNAVLSITLEEADYAPRLDSELIKYRQKASFKGFRKGKTPKKMVKRLMGKSVLAEIINELIQKELLDYIAQNEIHLLGQPIPSESQSPINFDLDELQDYEFKFDIGLSPEFEVEGLSTETTLQKYVVNITDEQVDDELNAARRRFGERIYPDEIQDSDFLKLSVRELEDGAIRKEGMESTFSLLMQSIADESVKQAFIGKKLGEVLQLNLLTLEKDRDEAYVRKYYLNLAADDERQFNPEFEATIEEISRVQTAELNQDFFDKYFGQGEVSTEEEAREKIREFIRKRYDHESEGLLSRDLQDLLMERNQMTLPDAFLKRWLLIANDKLTEAQIEEYYPGFAKNLRWTLIRSKLLKKLDISVNKEEVAEAFKARVRSYFGASPYANEDFINSMAARLMEDEKQLDQTRDEILDDKLYTAMGGEVTLQEVPMEVDSFELMVAEARTEAMKARGETGEEE